MEPMYVAKGLRFNEWLQCSICLDVYKNPMILSCSHIFCKTCIDTWAEQHRQCPMCNADLRRNDLKPAPSIYRKMLSSLRVRCSNHQNGCSTTFPEKNWQKQMTEHLAECPYESELCVCGQRVVRKHMKSHLQDECEMTVVCCPNNCGQKTDRKNMANHNCFKALTSVIRLMKEDSRKQERRTISLPKDMTHLQTQLVRVENEFSHLKDEMKRLTDEARRQIDETGRDLQAVKRDMTSALTQILRWAMPAVESLQERASMSQRTRQRCSVTWQNESLTFSKQSPHLLNSVSLPSPSASNIQRQSLSVRLSDEKHATSQSRWDTRHPVDQPVENSIDQSVLSLENPTSPVWYCEWCLNSNSRSKVLCSECRRHRCLPVPCLSSSPNTVPTEYLGLWVCSVCQNINSHSDCICTCGQPKGNLMLSMLLDIHKNIEQLFQKQLELWKKVNTIVSGDTEECSRTDVVTILRALKHNVHQLLHRQIKLWTKLPTDA